MNFYKQDDLEEAASLAIDNTENNAARQQQLAAFGFGPARFNTGKALLKTFTDKQAEQARCQNEQWSLSKQLNASLLAVNDQFREHALVVQAAFRRDAELLHSLKIDRFATRRWEGVRQAIHFYRQLKEQKVSLANYGVSDKDLQQAYANATQLQQLKQMRADKKSHAEQCTQDKMQVQKELRQWVSDSRTTARMAFREQPQTLEAFGIQVSAKA
jgi:hypothetical protein